MRVTNIDGDLTIDPARPIHARKPKIGCVTGFLASDTTWMAPCARALRGFLIVGRCEVGQLYLRTDLRRIGIGGALVARAKRLSPQELRLVTSRQNHGASAFYECHGFRPVAFRYGSQNQEGIQDVVYEWRPDTLT